MLKDLRASEMFVFLRASESVAAISRRLKMSEKTIRKYRDAGQLPSQTKRPERTYRTRTDPLAEFWKTPVRSTEANEMDRHTSALHSSTRPLTTMTLRKFASGTSV